MFPASRIFAPFAPIPPGDNPHTLQAPSPGLDQWRLRLRTPTDPASPSPPSPGPSRPGGAVAGLGPARSGPRPLAAPSPGPDRWRLRLRAHTRAASARHPLTCPYCTDARGQSYHPLECPYGTDARGQSYHPLACPYGTDARGQSHPSNSAHPRQKTGLSVFTAKSRASQRLRQSGSTAIILQTLISTLMKSASSTAVNGSRCH